MKKASLFAALALTAAAFAADHASAQRSRRRANHPQGHHEWRHQRARTQDCCSPQWVKVCLPDSYRWKTVRVECADRYVYRNEQVRVPGGYTCRTERYLICPGRWVVRHCRRVWMPPRYGTRTVRIKLPDRCEYRRVKVRISGGYTFKRIKVRVPGGFRWEQKRQCHHGRRATKRVKVWVPGVQVRHELELRIGGNHGGFGFSLNFRS